MTTDVTTESAVAPPPAAYPINLDVTRPETSSRLLNFPLALGLFIRYLLLVPHFVILFFVGAVALVLYLIATVAILFTGRFPLGMYNFIAGYFRWNANAGVYAIGLVDKYPPFSMEQKEGYPVGFSAEHPEKSNRILNFPVIGLYIKEILLIPHFVAIVLLAVVLYLILIIAPFAVLFTGKYPAPMHRFAVGFDRWSTRLSAYVLALTDRYPPFSLS